MIFNVFLCIVDLNFSILNTMATFEDYCQSCCKNNTFFYFIFFNIFFGGGVGV